MANAVEQPEETEYHNCGAGEQAGAYRLGSADNGATLSWYTLQPSARNGYQHESWEYRTTAGGAARLRKTDFSIVPAGSAQLTMKQR